MENEKDPTYEAFSKLMDTVFDLADYLNEVNPEDLTTYEVNLLEALDMYCELVVEEDEDSK